MSAPFDGNGIPGDRRTVVSWVLYDWANSAFALTVLAGFFPVFFAKFWSGSADQAVNTIRLTIGTTAAGLTIALLSPLLGSLAGVGHRRKRYLVSFMLLGAVMTSLLFVIRAGAWQVALSVFVLANVGFSCANLFYDSLLPVVASKDRFDTVSSFGFAAGYLGGSALFVVNMLMVNDPSRFGLSGAEQAVKLSFISVGVWWLIFSIPLVIFVREADATHPPASRVIRQGLRKLVVTGREVLRTRHMLLFLLAYWLYIDGVHTFIRLASNFGIAIGLDAGFLMMTLLVVQLVAFPSALGFGFLAARIGALRSLLIGIAIYVVVAATGALFLRTSGQYLLFAILQATAMGSLQALSRSYFAAMIPPERSSEFFGFYNLTGKFAVFFGPALVGIVTMATRSLGASSILAVRLGMCSTVLLFGGGGIVLYLSHMARK